jgi:hypothetical protein
MAQGDRKGCNLTNRLNLYLEVIIRIVTCQDDLRRLLFR